MNTTIDLEKDFTEYVPDHYSYITKSLKWFRYVVLMGGRSSMKSWQAARKVQDNSFDDDTDQVIFQKNLAHARENTHKLLIETIERSGYGEFFEYSTSASGNLTIYNKTIMKGIDSKGRPIYNKIIFREFKNEDSIKGLEGFRHVWIDEADQMSLSSFQKIDDSLRTFDNTNIYLTFNPVSPFCWIKTKFIDTSMSDEFKQSIPLNRYHTPKGYNDVPEGLWLNREEGIIIHWTSYLQNQFIPQNYFDRKDRERDQNPTYWQVNDMGFFGAPEGLVFPNFEIRDFDYSQFDLYQGVDWGDTHPNFFLKVAVNDVEKEIYVCEEYAGCNLPIEEIRDTIKKMAAPGVIYADSAAPTLIRYMQEVGIDMDKVDKTKVTVEDQIKKLKSYKIVSRPENTWFNKQAYLYKYPDSGLKDTPKKINDDGYDCLRYALFTWFGYAETFDSQFFDVKTGW